MSESSADPLRKVTDTDDLLGKVRSFLSGFIGYVERDQRREADRILRQEIAQRYGEQWSRISEIQRELISSGDLDRVDDLEAAAIKLRGFIDRVSGASYGYAGFFDHVRIGDDELARLYEYDRMLFEQVEQISAAVDNVESSIGTDGLDAAIRHLVTLSQEAIDTYNRRREIILET